MNNIKTKINNIKLNIIKKVLFLKSKINTTEKEINKIKVNTIIGYTLVVFVGGILIGMNASNFITCLSVNYPELKLNNVTWLSGKTASLKYANTLIKKDNDINKNIDNKEKTIENVKFSSEVMEYKKKIKQSILERSGNTINEITVEKRQNYILQINEVLIKLNNQDNNNDNEIKKSTAKLLALKEIIVESLNLASNNEKNIIFNSAEEKSDNSKKVELKKENTNKNKIKEKNISKKENKQKNTDKTTNKNKIEEIITKKETISKNEEKINKNKIENNNSEIKKEGITKNTEINKKEELVKTEEKKVIEPVAIEPNIKPTPKSIIIKPIKKPEFKPTIIDKIEKPIIFKKNIIEPVIDKKIKKPTEKTTIKIEKKPTIIKPLEKNIIKIEKKEIKEKKIEKPIIKTVTTNNTDPISKNINNNINSILTKLNAEIYNGFKFKTLKNDNLILENGVWYTYVYSKYHNFGKGVTPTETDLQRGKLDKNTTLLLLDNNGASFVTDYKKVKVISDYIVNNISNKHVFLSELADDKKHLHSDTDELFKKLKNETINLTSGLSNSTKISKIYDYILKNISYSRNFNTANKEIFAGITTYKNKVGICSGYTKLDLYMLSFAGVPSVRVVNGHVLDAPDFPNIGHSWIQIGSRFYDPTFDDPIGNTKTKSYSEYKYYALPKDLFYTNRFNYGTMPSYLRTESLENRKKFINIKLAKLQNKYKNNNYLLLRPFTFKQKNKISTDDKMTIEKLKTIIPYYEVTDYKYKKNKQVKIIKGIDFFTANDSNIEVLLEQINYKLDGYILFKWDDGTYRLAYKVIT